MVAEAKRTNTNRSKNSAKNLVFGTASFVVKILIQFLVRAFFIRYLFVEYLGINGLFTNIISILSLAELGIGNVIVYSMYKPISENNVEKIKSLVHFYRNVYLVIALIVIVAGVAISPLLPYMIKDFGSEAFSGVNLYIIYFLYLSQTVVGYFFAYRRSLIFANQRNDIESKSIIVSQIILGALQLVSIIVFKNFYLYVLSTFISQLIDAVTIYIISYKMYPEISGKCEKLSVEEKKEIKKNTLAMVLHKVGGAVVFSTDSIFISIYIGSSILGIYSNYTLVVGAFGSIMTLFAVAIKGSVGNMVAVSDSDNSLHYFRLLSGLNFFIMGLITCGLVVCFQDFIKIFTGSSDYYLEFLTVVLVSLNFYLTYSKGVIGVFKETTGLFWNDRFKPLFESVLNLVLDLILVRYMGINGIIIATIVSNVLVPIWVEPYVLFKNYFKKNWVYYLLIYFGILAFNGLLTLGLVYACKYISLGDWGNLIVKALIVVATFSLVYILLFAKVGYTKHFKSILRNIFSRG